MVLIREDRWSVSFIWKFKVLLLIFVVLKPLSNSAYFWLIFNLLFNISNHFILPFEYMSQIWYFDFSLWSLFTIICYCDFLIFYSTYEKRQIYKIIDLFVILLRPIIILVRLSIKLNRTVLIVSYYGTILSKSAI